MEVELRHLRILSLLAEAGSITKAAARLGISQPTLSAQLNRIEQAFGGPLFGRSRGGLSSTPLGRHVLSRARAMITDMDDLLDAARNAKRRTGIRLGCFPTVILGEWLRRLESELPDREITTNLDYSGAVLTHLLGNDQVDAVLTGRVSDHHAPPCPAGTVERVISIEPCGVALPAAHRLAGRGQIELADLADEDWIPPQGGDDGGIAMLRSICEAVGFTPRFRYRDLEVNGMAGFVAAGFAVALVAPTWQPAPGVAVVALAGQSVDSYRVLRWRPSNISIEEIDILHRTHHAIYGPIIERHIAKLPWLANNPAARPMIVDADLNGAISV